MKLKEREMLSYRGGLMIGVDYSCVATPHD